MAYENTRQTYEDVTCGSIGGTWDLHEKARKLRHAWVL